MSPDGRDLTGKIAVVTGAVRGLGLAIARALCAGGAHVFLGFVHSEREAAEAVGSLAGLPGSAAAVRADLTDPAAVPGLLAAVTGAGHPRLDVFVHNAASWRPTPAVGADTDVVWQELHLALDPLLHGAGPLAEAMAGGPGRIVAVSSSGARAVVPHYTGQGLAKAALESLVRYLAVELAPRGVTVNAVSTGKLDKGPQTRDAQLMSMLAARTPAGRLTVPADVAAAVALLCTDAAGWIQGQVVSVDGGLGLRA